MTAHTHTTGDRASSEPHTLTHTYTYTSVIHRDVYGTTRVRADAGEREKPRRYTGLSSAVQTALANESRSKPGSGTSPPKPKSDRPISSRARKSVQKKKNKKKR